MSIIAGKGGYTNHDHVDRILGNFDPLPIKYCGHLSNPPHLSTWFVHSPKGWNCMARNLFFQAKFLQKICEFLKYMMRVQHSNLCILWLLQVSDFEFCRLLMIYVRWISFTNKKKIAKVWQKMWGIIKVPTAKSRRAY